MDQARTVVSGERSAFVRMAATAVAIVLIGLGLVVAVGGMRYISPAVMFNGAILAAIAAHLPATFELIVVSFIVASAIGYALTRPSARWWRRVVAAFIIIAGSIPLFVLAYGLEILLAGFGRGMPMSPSSGHPFNLGAHLAALIPAAGVLVVVQLPMVVDFYNHRRAAGLDGSSKGVSIPHGLATLFSGRLADIIAASMIVDLMYRWPGEGRWLGVPFMVKDGQKPELVAFLLFNALVVVVVRFLVHLLARFGGRMPRVSG